MLHMNGVNSKILKRMTGCIKNDRFLFMGKIDPLWLHCCWISQVFFVEWTSSAWKGQAQKWLIKHLAFWIFEMFTMYVYGSYLKM